MKIPGAVRDLWVIWQKTLARGRVDMPRGIATRDELEQFLQQREHRFQGPEYGPDLH